ncbi:hypothetical protein AMTR_s00005p00081400 [Amborella trichopoda]|uniref:Uncharacterized protein n=1 Tax=Amborella trichopoda TaxID=13333 RepID=W1PA32_AMBTC|nr:hypothetical protein AMTR_s00005p00081400 [Amborella trichopoda]
MADLVKFRDVQQKIQPSMVPGSKSEIQVEKKADNSKSSASLSVTGSSRLTNISFENFEEDLTVSLLDKCKKVKEDYNGIKSIEAAIDFAGGKCVDCDIVKPAKVVVGLVCRGYNQGKVFEDEKHNMTDWIKISDVGRWDKPVGLKAYKLKDPGFCGGEESSSGSSGSHDSPTTDLVVVDPELCAMMANRSQNSVDLKVPLEGQGLSLVVTKDDNMTHLVDGDVVVNIGNVKNFDHSGVEENFVHFGVGEKLLDVGVMENYDCVGVRDITLDDSDAQVLNTMLVMGASFNVPDAVVVKLFRDRVKAAMKKDILKEGVRGENVED